MLERRIVKIMTLFIGIIFVGTIVFTFTACSDDNSLVGRWRWDDYQSIGSGSIIEFYRNGKGKDYNDEDMTWSVSNGRLTLIRDEGRTVITSDYSVKGSKLTIYKLGVHGTVRFTKLGN